MVSSSEYEKDSQAQDKFVQIEGGLNICYKLVRSDPDSDNFVVLVNGLGCHKGYATEAMEALVGLEYNVLCYDNRGMGQTYPIPEATTIPEMANDLKGLLDALKIKSVYLAGHSMGGMICAHFSVMYPEMVKALSIVQSPAYVPPSISLIVQAFSELQAKAGEDPEVLRTLVKLSAGMCWSPSILKELDDDDILSKSMERAASVPVSPIAHWAQTKAAIEWSFEEYLNERLPHFSKESVRFPRTQIIWGEGDLLVPSSISKHFREVLLSHREVLFNGDGEEKISEVCVANVSHIFPQEYPKQFANVLDGFLRYPGKELCSFKRIEGAGMLY